MKGQKGTQYEHRESENAHVEQRRENQHITKINSKNLTHSHMLHRQHKQQLPALESARVQSTNCHRAWLQ